MSDAEKKKKLIEERNAKAAEINKKRSMLAQQRSRKLISNLLISAIILTVIGVGLASVGMGYLFIFVTTGLMPGIVANITDRRPGRFASKTVMAFNASGIIPHLSAIITSGTPNSTSATLLTDPHAWLLIYGFAAFGWGVIYLVPHIVQLYLEMRAGYTTQKLLQFQKILEDEWGENVKK